MESSMKRMPKKKSGNEKEESQLTSTIKKLKIEKQLQKQKLIASTTSLGLTQGIRNSKSVIHPMSPSNQSALNLKDISFGKPSTSFMSKRSSLCTGADESRTINLFNTLTRDSMSVTNSAVRKDR